MSSYLRYPLLVLLWMVALMSGGFSLFRELYGLYSGTVPARSMFWSCTLIAFILSAAILWAIEHKSNNSHRPKLILALGDCVWKYEPAAIDKTVFFLLAEILNQGEPSITRAWAATYTCDGITEPMQAFYIHDAFSIVVGNKTLVVKNADLLNVQTQSGQIERGGHRGGRLLWTLPGNRTEQINSKEIRIDVTCQDYLLKPAKGVYVSSPSGVLSELTFLPNETVKA
jgi:hypothetical protein